MSKIGDALAGYDDEIMGWLGDDLEVTNFEDTDTTEPTGLEYEDLSGKRVPTVDSPHAAQGQVGPRSPNTPPADAAYDPWGKSVDADMRLLIESSAPVSDGTIPGLPYESHVEVLDTGAVYAVQAIHDEGNGILNCAVRRVS